MIRTRQYRTNVFREQVEKEWTEYFWKFIEDNFDKPWDWRELSYNTFSKEKQQFIDRKYKEHLSAYRIQQCWNRAISVPTNPICQRKQIRDYEKCFGRLCC